MINKLVRNQISNSTIGYAAEAPAPDEARLPWAVRRLASENEALSQLVGELEQLNDRIVGSAPTLLAGAAPSSTPQAVPNGHLDELHETISRTARLVGHVRDQIDRAKAIG